MPAMIRKAINMIRHWCNCRLKCKFSTLFILFSYDFDFYLISVFIFCFVVFRRLKSRSMFLMDCGTTIMILVGLQVPIPLLQNVFGKPKKQRNFLVVVLIACDCSLSHRNYRDQRYT